MSLEKKLIEPHKILPQDIEKLDRYSNINFRNKSEGRNFLLNYFLEPDLYKYGLICEEKSLLKILLKHNISLQFPDCLQKIQTYEDGSFLRLLTFIDGNLIFQQSNIIEILINSLNDNFEDKTDPP